MKTIGFVGVGDMGRPMAERLLAAGYEVAVCDANRAVLDQFARRGVKASRFPRDVAQADAIVLMVATDRQLLDVTGGENGVVHGFAPSAGPLVLVMSTCLPATVSALAELVKPLGARVVDAPVSGGRAGAEAGRLSIMLGGDPADIEAADPILKVMGARFFRCGGLGSAQVVKLINNMIGLTSMFVSVEGFAMARAHGIALEALLPVLDASSGRSSLSADLTRVRDLFSSWSETPETFASLRRITAKDLEHASEVAHEAGVATPLLDGLRAILDEHAFADLERWREIARCAAKELGSGP